MLLFGIAAELVIFVAAQALVAAALGASLFRGATLWQAARWKQALAFVAGPIAGYLACSVLFVLSFTLEGVPGPTLYLATVTGPAQAAGLREGDRVISIGGHPIAAWDDVPRTVRAANDRPLTFVVERGGVVTSIVVTPVHGRVGVASRIENKTAPLARAAPAALVAPVKSGIAWLGALAADTGPATGPSGPVAVVGAARRAWAYLGGLLSSLAWPFALITDALGFGLACVFGRRATPVLKSPGP